MGARVGEGAGAGTCGYAVHWLVCRGYQVAHLHQSYLDRANMHATAYMHAHTSSNSIHELHAHTKITNVLLDQCMTWGIAQPKQTIQITWHASIHIIIIIQQLNAKFKDRWVAASVKRHLSSSASSTRSTACLVCTIVLLVRILFASSIHVYCMARAVEYQQHSMMASRSQTHIYVMQSAPAGALIHSKYVCVCV